jgi:hypothetical protein
LLTGFNSFIFISVALTYWRPDVVPVPITGDAVIGLHLQLFEAFLAALSIGLAVFGFVGYAAIRESAERRAEEVSRNYMQRFGNATNDRSVPPTEKPDLSGLNENGQPGARQPEEDI